MRRRSCRFHSRLRLACLLVVVAASCRPSSESVSSPLRFIEKDPQENPAPGMLLEVATVREWRFSSLLADWTVGGRSSETAQTDDGIELSSSQRQITLRARVDFDASSVDTILVVLQRPEERRSAVPVRLAWSRRGEGLSSEREIVVSGRPAVPNAEHAIRFPLQGHPLWKGPISTVRLAFPPPKTVVKSITLAKETVAAAKLAELSEGFKAEIANEVRNVLPAIPGISREKTLRVPRDARLRFSYALQGNTYTPVRFAVSFLSPDGEAEELFEGVLDRQSAAGGWHSAEVDLDVYAGRRGILRLDTSADPPFSLTQGLPLWGNPEVVFEAPVSRPNVVLISVDTLRADRLSLYGYQWPTTPNLDAWAGESAAVFRSAVAQCPWTLPSHVSMLSGTDPFRHGVNYSKSTIPASLVMLAEVLRDSGYRTLAVTGGTLLHPRYGFSQGFDRYWYFADNRAAGQELASELDRALAWIDERHDAPFFLFFHTYEVHTPYRSREPYFGQFTDLPPVDDMRIAIPDPEESDGYLWKVDSDNLRVESPPELRDLDWQARVNLASAAYDSGIAYTDEHLTKLFDKLREKGLDDDTIVVLTSDHGEMLGEYGLVNHRYLYEENILVPLVIADPNGRGAGRVIPDQVRSVDIVPTILELAGLAAPPEIDGRSLVPLLDGKPSPVPDEAWTYSPESNYGVSLRLANRLKYIFNDTVWPQAQGTEYLYALKPVANERDSMTPSTELDRLRRQARTAIAASPGLRVRFGNGEQAAVSGSLGGGLIRFNTVKALDLPCACLELEPFTAKFQVPPGESYTLIIGGVTEEPLSLRLTAVGAEGESFDFANAYRPEDFHHLKVIGLSETGWREFDRQGRPPTYVEIWWHGAHRAHQSTIAGPDPELLERLRALGYVQ